jgi:hypothetical protein
VQKSEQYAFSRPVGAHDHGHAVTIDYQVDTVDDTLATSLEGETFEFNRKRKTDRATADTLKFGDWIKHRRDV